MYVCLTHVIMQLNPYEYALLLYVCLSRVSLLYPCGYAELM